MICYTLNLHNDQLHTLFTRWYVTHFIYTVICTTLYKHNDLLHTFNTHWSVIHFKQTMICYTLYTQDDLLHTVYTQWSITHLVNLSLSPSASISQAAPQGRHWHQQDDQGGHGAPRGVALRQDGGGQTFAWCESTTALHTSSNVAIGLTSIVAW